MPTVDDRRQQRHFRRAITLRPLDYGLGPLPHGAIHMPDSAPPATSARSAKTSSPACKRRVVGHRPSGSGGAPSPAGASSSRPFFTAQTTSSCFEWTPTLS